MRRGHGGLPKVNMFIVTTENKVIINNVECVSQWNQWCRYGWVSKYGAWVLKHNVTKQRCVTVAAPGRSGTRSEREREQKGRSIYPPTSSGPDAPNLAHGRWYLQGQKENSKVPNTTQLNTQLGRAVTAVWSECEYITVFIVRQGKARQGNLICKAQFIH